MTQQASILRPVAGGWSRPTACALWIIVACRHVPTILYLRNLFGRRRQKQGATVNGSVIVVQALLLIFVCGLLFFKIAPALTMVDFVILFGRAMIGLFNKAEPTPKKLGISEIAFGTFTVLMVAAGYRFGW